MGIGKKEWMAKHEDHEIRVVNTWLGGAQLYIDGELRDTCEKLLATDASRPLLSASIGERQTVEIFIESVVTTKAKICVNGTQVGGEVF